MQRAVNCILLSAVPRAVAPRHGTNQELGLFPSWEPFQLPEDAFMVARVERVLKRLNDLKEALDPMKMSHLLEELPADAARSVKRQCVLKEVRYVASGAGNFVELRGVGIALLSIDLDESPSLILAPLT